MIYENTDLKFKVVCSLKDFSLADDDFVITIQSEWQKVTVPKDGTFRDKEGNFYFILEGLAAGTYKATFCAQIADADFPDYQQAVTDRQTLCIIGGAAGRFPCACDDGEEHFVTYERIMTANVGGQTFLQDADGRYILDANGERIRLEQPSQAATVEKGYKIDLTGEELNTLLTGRKSDGTVNTIPELMDEMEGISDDSRLKDEFEPKDSISIDIADPTTASDLWNK